MHEYVYADRVLQTVLEDSGRSGKRTTTVKVEVGEMRVVKESLTKAYGVLSKGTKAEGSKLEVSLTRG